MQYDEYAVLNNGSDANPTVSWNGTPLTEAISQVGSATCYPFADIFYLFFNSTSGTSGSLTFSGYGRSAAFGAMTLSGVNTSDNPICSGGNGQVLQTSTSATASAVFSGTNSVTTPGSFAVVDEGCRVLSNTGNVFALRPATGVTAA